MSGLCSEKSKQASPHKRVSRGCPYPCPRCSRHRWWRAAWRGGYANGDPAINALGCSGHWFTEREDQPGRYAGDYLVAAGWYEHGTRFLSVDQKSGQISQVGYFQPIRGSASAAYWIDNTDYVYVVDYQRGIDILQFDPAAAPPTAAETRASWLAKLHTVDALSQEERYWCRQAMEQTR